MSVQAETLTKNSAVGEAMSTLTSQWYNAMVTGLGLSPDQFQLFQGPNSLMSTSQDMWNMFNAVPPATINTYYNPAQINNFSSSYNNILEALVPASDSSFQSCMGDYYMKWQSYFKDNPPKTWDAQGVSDVFNQWAMMNAPGKAGCVTGLTNIYINPINIAVNKFASAKESYAWNKTVEGIKTALAGGGSKSFTMDSETSSSETKHTWAKGGTSIFFDIFSFGASPSYDKLSEKATSKSLKIDASFDKVTTFASGPLAQNDPNDPILCDYKAWYESAALAQAYTTKDNTVWNNQSPITWDKAFGPNGFLQRSATSIVAADGIKITMTSKASYSSSEQTEIKAAANAGIWPFFSVSGEGGCTTSVKFNDDGSFTSETTIAKGNPQILGILQTSMDKLFTK